MALTRQICCSTDPKTGELVTMPTAEWFASAGKGAGVDVSAMSKAELYDHAKKLGVYATKRMTVDELVEAIEEGAIEDEDEDEDED